MADQDDVNQGSIPPKVSPFAKPEGASPITPAAPGAPRPITVRLRPVAPAAEGAAPAVPVVAAPAVGIPTPPPTNPRSTARVPVPESVAAAAPAAIRPATVRLRPVAAPGAAPAVPHAGSTQAISKIPTGALSPSATVPVPLEAILPSAPDALAQMQPQHPPTPGANPLPEGPKPPSSAQVQAAKSKTSRISLDSAIGVAPVSEKEGPKTIRLKRPSDLAAPTATPTVQKTAPAAARQTSRIPDSALPTSEASAESSTVTQKKTLKIKRPGMKEEGAAPEVAAAGGEGFPEGVQLTPLSLDDFPAKEESSVFTTISAVAAFAAMIMVAVLLWFLAAHAVGSVAGKNALAFIQGPDLPCPGRIVN